LPLTSGSDLDTGKHYRIINGPGHGLRGLCVDVDRGAFDRAWGTIQTPTGTFTAVHTSLELDDQEDA
jgi:hypothetical protein